jgi:hypothetical protein
MPAAMMAGAGDPGERVAGLGQDGDRSEEGDVLDPAALEHQVHLLERLGQGGLPSGTRRTTGIEGYGKRVA